jgi:hypothetical protein
MGKDPLLTTKEEEDKRQEDLKDFSAQPANHMYKTVPLDFSSTTVKEQLGLAELKEELKLADTKTK